MPDQLQQWKTASQAFVWPRDIDGLPFWRRLVTRAAQVLYALARDLLDGQLTLRAMSLVYTTLLSMVPLLALTFSVLKGFGVHNQLEPMLLGALSALGDKSVEITKNIVSFVENIKVGVLGALGLGMLIYTVISLLHKIEQAFNYTWRITQSRPIGQRFSEYLSVVLVGPLLVFSALGITASLLSSTVVQSLAAMPVLGFVVASVGKLIPYMLVIAAFTFIYVFMPNTKVRIGAALIGGIVSGVLWQASGWAFGAFVVSSGKYTAVYSGFAILMMFMIWLFVSWLVLLLGASIAYYCQHPEDLTLERAEVRFEGRAMDKLALMAMVYIGRHYHLDQRDWDIQSLSDRLGVPSNVAQAVIEALHDCGLIIQTGEPCPPFVPAQDTEMLTIKGMLDRIGSGARSKGFDYGSIGKSPVVESLFERMDTALGEALREQTLRDLIQLDAKEPVSIRSLTSPKP